jgi:hypothetical protein
MVRPVPEGRFVDLTITEHSENVPRRLTDNKTLRHRIERIENRIDRAKDVLALKGALKNLLDLLKDELR